MPTSTSPPKSAPTTEPATELRPVFLLESGEEIQHVLKGALHRKGFDLRSFAQPSAIVAAFEKTTPVMVLLEKRCLDNNSHDADCYQILMELKIPSLLISDNDDMPSRLQAVRQGVAHYVTRPINIETLLEILKQHSGNQQVDPYRVLIVDDDQLLASLYELTLKRAGFEVMTQFNAENIIEVLREFKPELIFMDVRMPECSGPEATAVIRQMPDLDIIPIVFLSADTHLELQLAALTLGGDDFLTKPIDQEHLIVTATARAARARSLQQTRQFLQ